MRRTVLLLIVVAAAVLLASEAALAAATLDQKAPTVTSSGSRSGSGTQVQNRVNPICISSHLSRLSLSDIDKQTTLMQQAGIKWVRLDVVWAAIEQTKGVYSWSKWDYIVDNVTAKGMKPLAVTDQYGIPSWERIDPTNPMSTPNSPQDFQNFVQAVATRYKGKISLYEIGNEPNIATFWPSGPNAQAYTQLLSAGYKGVKAADSTNKVISAGLANVPAESNTTAYIKAMYANGAGAYFDYFGFHPYSSDQSPDYTQKSPRFSYVATVRNLMKQNGDSKKGIMATEVGWPTVASGAVDEPTQASYINRVYQKIEYEDYQYLPIACVYDFVDDGAGTTNREDNYGTLRYDYSQKPSYRTMQQARQNFDAGFNSINP